MKYIVPLKESVLVTDDYTYSEIGSLYKNIRADLHRIGCDYRVPLLRENLTLATMLDPPFMP